MERVPFSGRMVRIVGGPNFTYIYVYIWLCWISIAAQPFFRFLSLVVGSRGHSSLHCSDFSFWWLLLSHSTGSRAQAQRLWCMDLVAPWMWDLPRSGIQCMSPAWAGGFLSTEPPRKSKAKVLKENGKCYCSEHMNDKGGKKQPYCWYGKFSSLGRSYQPQQSLKPKPNAEQSPNSLHF